MFRSAIINYLVIVIFAIKSKKFLIEKIYFIFFLKQYFMYYLTEYFYKNFALNLKIKTAIKNMKNLKVDGAADGARTRDLRRDRAAF